MTERRPCWVNGRKGMFHRWIEKEDVIVKSTIHFKPDVMKIIRDEYVVKGVLPNGCTVEKIRNTYALIEFEDGHIEHIPPTTITFLDHSDFDGYDWRRSEMCPECEYFGADCLEEPCFSCIGSLGSEDRFESRK